MIRSYSLCVVNQEEQRYDTVGDWQLKMAPFSHGRTAEQEMFIDVSDTGADDYNILIAVHELIEAYLCKKRNISTEEVDRFDFKFSGVSEPGDAPDCPYRREHFFATTVERMLAAELGVDWAVYDRVVNNLIEEKLYGDETKNRATKQTYRPERCKRTKHTSGRRKQPKHKGNRKR